MPLLKEIHELPEKVNTKIPKFIYIVVDTLVEPTPGAWSRIDILALFFGHNVLFR